eukprot:TRINITY_DN88872_c0_g1_i1.p1 TRINITY_DN88872_c0_g1~~TRINITY_DN88872_c0_g1_i1.p1  ORF type:complete len:1082 (-),score=164.16 TRINITY_DN88872_c0_g1_i1:73-3318(-)
MTSPDPLLALRLGPYSLFCVCTAPPQVCIDDENTLEEFTPPAPLEQYESDSPESDGEAEELVETSESQLDVLHRELQGQVLELPWLSSIFEHLWPKLDQAVCKIVKDSVEPKMRELLPAWFKGIYFKNFTMGAKPPALGPIRVYLAPCLRRDEQQRGLELQIDISLENQVDIDLCFLRVTAGINALKLRGTFVIRLDPFVHQLPVVGGVVCYFRDPPEIEVDFSGIADVADWGMIASTVHRTIDSCFADAIVLPNLIAVNMFDDEAVVDTAQLRDPKPVGVLRVTALSASDLVGADWHLFNKSTSDPYVRLKLGADGWSSSVVKDTCHPHWKASDTHDFLVYDVMQELHIQVLDYGFCRNALIGFGGAIPVKDLWRYSGGSIPLSASATDRSTCGSLLMRFEWLRLTPGQLGAESCLVRIEVDSAYMPSAAESKVASAGLVARIGTKDVSTPKVEPKRLNRIKAVNMRLNLEQVLRLVVPRAALKQKLELSLVGIDQRRQSKKVFGECSISLSDVASAVDFSRDFQRLRFKSDSDQIISVEVRVRILGLQRLRRNEFKREMRQLRPDMCVPTPSLQTERSRSLSTGWCDMDAVNLAWGVLWPSFKETLEAFVEDPNGYIAKSLRDSVANTPFANTTFRRFDLGKAYPQFGPIKVNAAPARGGRISNQGVEIHVGLILDSEADISLSVLNMSVGMRRLKVQGELLIRIEPLIGESPVVGGIVFCFLDAPKLDFDFTGIATVVGLADNWILAGAVREAINGVLARSLVLPNVIGVPMGTEAQGVDRCLLRQPRPLGVLRVSILRARGLPGRHWHLFRERTSNPYLRIGMADKSWHSPIVEGTCDPTWGDDAVYNFIVWDYFQKLSIEVLEAGMLDPFGDDVLGKARPLTVAEAIKLSRQPLDLFPKDSDLDKKSTTRMPCGSVELNFEWLQRLDEGATDDHCFLRVKVDEVYAPTNLQHKSLGLKASVGHGDQRSVQVKALTKTEDEDFMTFEFEQLFYFLIKSADLAGGLELELFDPNASTVATTAIGLHFSGKRRQWCGDDLLTITGEKGVSYEAEVDVAIQGLGPGEPPSDYLLHYVLEQ